MRIDFVDKNGRRIIISVSTEIEGDVLMQLLSKLPDSEFILRPRRIGFKQ